jgi:ribosomal protein L31
MPKKGLHPEFYKTKIFCDGKQVLEVGTTKEEMYVDI